MGRLRQILLRANRHPLWATERRVWGSRLAIPTADRLLYATLHQLGLMGADDRRFYEAELRPGMTVLDIGANIGLCTQLFSRLVGPGGRVYAFEPDRDLCRALAASCGLNGAANVTVFPCGLGAADEERPLRRSVLNSGDNRVGASGPGQDGGGLVSLRRGDGLLPAPLTADFIKIDVQGWELHALRGLQALIERSPRLQIYLEFWPQGLRAAGTEPAALFGFLRERGFAILRRTRDGRWVPADALEAITGPLGRQQFVNLRALKPG